MKINLLSIMLLLFSLFKSQTVICNYTEINSISNGYICEGDDLVFTANLDTIVTGTISASNSILVTPSPNYSITIQPAFSCNNCTTDTGGTTIIPKKMVMAEHRKDCILIQRYLD